LLVTVAPKKRELPRSLTPAIGASGPHDFAVRSCSLVLRAGYSLTARKSRPAKPCAHEPPRPPHLTARFVTIASRPRSGETGIFKKVICPAKEANYFSRAVWTGQITLKGLEKLDFRRKGKSYVNDLIDQLVLYNARCGSPAIPICVVVSALAGVKVAPEASHHLSICVRRGVRMVDSGEQSASKGRGVSLPG
jgi:hypothetical protein